MSSAFLVIDQQPISLAQALDYLQLSGHLQPFLLEILYQHVLTQTLRSHVNFDISSATIEQRLIEFRMDYQLLDADRFQTWLVERGTDYETFRQQLVWEIAVNDLKTQVSQPKLDAVFQQRKSSFDQVVLSWIGFNTQVDAQIVRQQLESGKPFEQLASDYLTLTSSEDAIGLSEVLIGEDIPVELRSPIHEAEPGTLIGPLAIEETWYLVRVEELLPAELDEELQAELETEIFEQWLTEKVAAMTVQLQVN